MDARPAGSLRQRPHVRLFGWFAAAALVAIALLPGTIVEGVLASAGTPAPMAAGNQQVEADPTPTPTPSPTPESTPTPTPSPTPQSTPTPQPTPTPTPAITPTPTPVLETSAQISARTWIDPDGDPATADGHLFDGLWEFEGDFGAAEVQSAFPFSDWIESAFWHISYTADTAIGITPVPRDGYTLLDVRCAASHNPNGWQVDGTSVSWLAPATGGEPVSLSCSFFQTPSPETTLADILVWKHIDTDGDLDSIEEPHYPPSWEFQAAFEDGVEIVVADPNTNRDQPAGWTIRLAGDSTRVVVTEVPQKGYRLVKASCFDAESDVGEDIPTSLDGNSLSFDVSGFGPIAPWPHGYWCNFWNVPVGAALPTLPPTDAATGSAAPGSDPWRVVLVGLAALIASILVLRTHPAARNPR